MRTYTTCAGCGRELLVERVRHDHHPECDPPPSYIRDLEKRYLAAVAAGEDAEADRLARLIDAYETRPPRYLDAALAYAAWGWKVFPCLPRRKTPLIGRDHGGHGLHDATTDPEQIRAWWTATPEANVGLATGGAFDVLDVDPAGLTTWVDLQDTLDLDIHGRVATPRDGWHLYLRPTGGGNLAGIAPGIDYRGAGGYVLAPPSTLGPEAYRDSRGQSKPLPTLRPPWRYSWWSMPSPVITGQVGSR